jgi:hypothetical protein
MMRAAPLFMRNGRLDTTEHLQSMPPHARATRPLRRCSPADIRLTARVALGSIANRLGGLPRLRCNGLALLAATLLYGCALSAPPAAWRIEAHASLEQAIDAYLAGDARAAEASFGRARREIGRSGRVGLLARAELARCAAAVASTVFEPCVRFESLRIDASEADRAYADYLRARLAPERAQLLPAAHRPFATTALDGEAALVALRAIDDPLSRLVALGVQLQTGRADPRAISLAVETASEQGWRRPLLAWLNVQLSLAEKAGAEDQARRIRRRIDVVAP